jgi:hypothetical protein
MADQTITCKVDSFLVNIRCQFYYITVEKNETVSIGTDPEDADPSTITLIKFIESSIHSVPPELFMKFKNVMVFHAVGQKIHEMHPNTFENAKKLKGIHLYDNALNMLHKDTFKGDYF